MTPIVGARIGPWGAPPVLSDDAGRFRIEELDPSRGSVKLVAEADGFAKLFYREVTLLADRDIDGVELRLERATPIAGRVVDEQGRPLMGVYLDLQRDRKMLHLANGKTGPDGRFIFEDDPDF